MICICLFFFKVGKISHAQEKKLKTNQMKKYIYSLLLTLTVATLSAQSYYIPYSEEYVLDGDGMPISFGGFTASNRIANTDSRIQGWVTGVDYYKQGADGGTTNPNNLIGKTGGSTQYTILGNGGVITATFESALGNGAGYDFAVFENGFKSGIGVFYEAAFVEVSTDGIHFVRFPTVDLGGTPIGAFGSADPTNLYNFAGKYEVGYGVGYDLAELQYVYDYITSADNMFSAEYTAEFLANWSYIDIDYIAYVRIVDIIGGNATDDFDERDSYGNRVYDCYKTVGTGGFDLTGIAAINYTTKTEPIPEPSTYAAIFGTLALAFAIYRRKSRK